MQSDKQNRTAAGSPLERRVRPLSPEADRLMQELVQSDPRLRKWHEGLCEPKTECRRGPFGCDCGRKLR